MKFLNEGSMSDVYYTFQDIANNPDYSDADAIAQIKNVMIHPGDDSEQFVARKLKLMHDTIAKHPSYKNDPMGVYEEMLDMIRTEYHDETYESKEMNPTTQTFSEDDDTNSLEQWKADVRKQYPQQASQIKFKGKGFGDSIVAEIPGKDQAFGEFNMKTGDAWVAPMDESVSEALDKEGDYHVSVQKGKFLPSDRGGGSDENLNYLHDLMNISGTGGGPMLVTISDPRIATEVAAMYGGTVLKTRYGTYRIVQSKGQNQKTPTPEPELVGMRESGVAEGNYPNYPKEPDLDQDKRDFKRQELQHELGHERNNYAVVIDGRTWKVFADQRKAQNIARNLKSRGKNASVQETGASPTSESIEEVNSPGTANKKAWDKGHDAGYTGNEKCPCKPGSAEEKAWNAGHKVGRDERSHERHGVKEGNMKSSENNPTGPSFAGGKLKGTDSAAQAKNKYVGEDTMPSVKLMRNIAEGLVRVDDVVLNRPVYGKPTDQDRRAVYRMVREFADAGIDYNDAVIELVEYFKHELSELAVAPTIPAVGGQPATTTAPTGTPSSTTANTAAKTPDTVSSTNVVKPPVTQQGVDALAQMVKNAGLSPSQISNLMSKAK
jgi:hypothetical protein